MRRFYEGKVNLVMSSNKVSYMYLLYHNATASYSVPAPRTRVFRAALLLRCPEIAPLADGPHPTVCHSQGIRCHIQ